MIYQFWLAGPSTPAQSDLAARFTSPGRSATVADPALSTLVSLLDVDRYNKNMSLVENLLFGTLVGPGCSPTASRAIYCSVLADAAHSPEPWRMSAGASPRPSSIPDLPPGHPSSKGSSSSPPGSARYRALLGRLGVSVATLPAEDRSPDLSPPMSGAPSPGADDAELEARLRARHAFTPARRR
jgi:hypothetical protein